ncbi:hypothetical protein H6504_02265 [Candidatus Woesearchaeota archaeon]|nr:hypothetical protein [Candidatus Woesearchaeota archaeon]
MNKALQEYIKKERGKGFSNQEIVGKLIQSGYSKRLIYQIMYIKYFFLLAIIILTIVSALLLLETKPSPLETSTYFKGNYQACVQDIAKLKDSVIHQTECSDFAEEDFEDACKEIQGIRKGLDQNNPDACQGFEKADLCSFIIDFSYNCADRLVALNPLIPQEDANIICDDLQEGKYTCPEKCATKLAQQTTSTYYPLYKLVKEGTTSCPKIRNEQDAICHLLMDDDDAFERGMESICRIYLHREEIMIKGKTSFNSCNNYPQLKDFTKDDCENMIWANRAFEGKNPSICEKANSPKDCVDILETKEFVIHDIARKTRDLNLCDTLLSKKEECIRETQSSIDSDQLVRLYSEQNLDCSVFADTSTKEACINIQNNDLRGCQAIKDLQRKEVCIQMVATRTQNRQACLLLSESGREFCEHSIK